MVRDHLEDVLNSCVNYDNIINFTPEENDELSKIIIRYYQDYVFFNWNENEKIKELDRLVYEYIINRDFCKFVKSKFDNEDVPIQIFDLLVNIYDLYKEESIKKIENAKWI